MNTTSLKPAVKCSNSTLLWCLPADQGTGWAGIGWPRQMSSSGRHAGGSAGGQRAKRGLCNLMPGSCASKQNQASSIQHSAATLLPKA